MNARDESSSSGSSMGTPRVSARTRFAPSTPTVATSPGAGSYDYGSNDNYRVVVRKSSSLSKGGINGTNDNGGVDLAAGGSLVKGALKKNTSSSSGAATSGASANKDRPWRNNSSSSSSAPRRTNYDGNYDEDTVEFSASSLATPPPPPSSKSSSNTSTSTTTLSTPTSRWAQYESDPNLEEESKIATSKAVVRVAERFAKHQRDVDDDMEMAENVDEEEVQSTATTAVMGGATGTGYDRTKAGTGAASATATTAAVEIMSTTDYVKSRLASLLLVDTKRQQKLQGEEQEEEDDDYSFGKKYIPDNSSSSNNSNYDHDRVRSEAFKMLNLANNRVCSPPRKGGNSINSGGDDDDDGNLNDTAADTTTNNTTTGAMNKATALFRTRGGGIAMREMQEDEIAEIRRNGIASIRGLDRFGKFDRSSNSSSSSYDANYGITSSDNSSAADHNTNMNDDPNEETPSLWSSRYSVERQLMAITGGLDSTRMLHRMDMLHAARDKTKSARGLYRASSNAMDGSHVEYGDYTTNSSGNLGFGFSAGDWGVWKWVRGTLWSDDVELNYDGTTQSLVKREKSMQHRRRLRFGLLFIVTLGIALGVLVHESNPNLAGSGGGGGGNVNFYVLADEPYEYANIEQLTRDLESVPSDADFVIHLGNVNGDEQSMCREYGFERAAAVLKESPVPVLVIPGDLDWAACGSEEESTSALNYWQIYLGQFDKYWNNANRNNQLVDVEYDTAVVGNFAFIHKGVLFVGISMIDGLTSPGEVTSRLERNVIWTKDKLTKYSSDNNNDEDGGKKSKGYHAVVIFGHAPPSDIQGEYFWPMLEQFKKVDVPVLYLHANKEGSFERYKPYDEADKFSAVQLEKRGLEGPMRVVVRGGKRNVDDKFVFERRQTSLEREEE